MYRELLNYLGAFLADKRRFARNVSTLASLALPVLRPKKFDFELYRGLLLEFKSMIYRFDRFKLVIALLINDFHVCIEEEFLKVASENCKGAIFFLEIIARYFHHDVAVLPIMFEFLLYMVNIEGTCDHAPQLN